MNFFVGAASLGLMMLLAIACGSRVGEDASRAGLAGSEIAMKEANTEKTSSGISIKDAYSTYFPVGVAVTPNHINTVGSIVQEHFNHLTAENDMKFGPIHPSTDKWEFSRADEIVEFAKENDMKMTGHTLVWHRMQPDWLFEGLEPQNPQSIDVLRTRLKDHIVEIVTRYADVVDNWDVVNEAISDDETKTYRDGAEGSGWYEIYGDESYIPDAFMFASQALENAGETVEGKLYYNDYNVTLKMDKIFKLVTWLRDEKDLPVAGVGFQAHWNLDWPSTADIEAAIQRFEGAGFKVKISELDLSIYCKDDWAQKIWEPEKTFTGELEALQAERYGTLFELFRKHKDSITGVTLWGVSDDATWLDNFPAENRNNYPLLFDDNHAPKASFREILDF